ncbi:putative glycosyl hydrolase [Streptomyces sp. NBRC 110611]|nr:putative glycosyl hydrolase [Streptomyces sp. NBRC 110611]
MSASQTTIRVLSDELSNPATIPMASDDAPWDAWGRSQGLPGEDAGEAVAQVIMEGTVMGARHGGTSCGARHGGTSRGTSSASPHGCHVLLVPQSFPLFPVFPWFGPVP